MCDDIHRGGYVLLNDEIDALLDHIDGGYEKLIQPYIFIIRAEVRNQVNVTDDVAFQCVFKDYFLRAGFPGREWLKAYFRLMDGGVDGLHPRQDESLFGGPDQVADLLGRVLRHLYDVSTSDKIPFSFSTKLLHVLNPDLPIYDSMVENFYHFPAFAGGDLDERIRQRQRRYKCLIQEYRRVLEAGDADRPIAKFRERFRQRGERVFTDTKALDTLIWQFCNLGNG